MWARSYGSRILLAPSRGVRDVVSANDSFDETWVWPIEASIDGPWVRAVAGYLGGIKERSSSTGQIA